MKLREMTRCGIFAALLAVCAWLSIPFGDQAVSLQSFGLFLALGLLGGRGGMVTVLVYLLLGAVGLPVFSGFRGGIAVLLGPTGGYLWGFAFSGLIYWLLERFGKLPAMIVAQLTCYLFGSFWFYLYTGGGLWLIIARCVLPFLLPDAIKIALACTLTRRLARHIT